LYKIYILIVLKISILRYFQNIVSISYRNWNPAIESSLLRSTFKSIDQPDGARSLGTAVLAREAEITQVLHVLHLQPLRLLLPDINNNSLTFRWKLHQFSCIYEHKVFPKPADPHSGADIPFP